MATPPRPRSYNEILSQMIDAFLSRTGIENLKVGSPILSILEAATQSDLRSSQDIFNYLNAISLDRAEGDALDAIGADEDLPRRGATLSSGFVSVYDSSITKITAKIFAGQPAPIVGSDVIYVDDASSFPATPFDIYIGRGTNNYEGPITINTKTQLTGYWQLDIASGDETQNFHNLNETITLAQGGTRSIPSGTIVQTANGNDVNGVKFTTLYAAFIPDGETEVNGIQIVAQSPGSSGNVPAGAINSFSSAPFSGATVSNLVPLTNGFDLETDEAYRERIRTNRQTKTKGTPLAIEQGVLGITAPDENKTVLSASVVRRQNYPTTLYIDDGSGYEEKYRGIPYEILVASAKGGEKYFQVLNYPVYKALIESSIQQPYQLVDAGVLAVEIGGTKYEHIFDASDFVNISNASAYEVVASINGNPSIPFGAKLSNSSLQFKIFAKADTNENIEVVEADEIDNDMAEILGLNYNSSDTLLLYKNDRLLSKDGASAIVYSEPQSSWANSLTVPATITINVDGTGATLYTINNSDFINNNTGYTTVSSANSLDSWVTVLNRKIPGITAFKSGSQVGIRSNLGTSNSASIVISGGTLVTDSVIQAVSSVGYDNDYTFNRNTGQIELTEVLVAGDTLTLGSNTTSGFVESDVIQPVVLSSDAKQWYVVDGSAERIATGISAGQTATFNTVGAGIIDTPSGEEIASLVVTGTPFLNTRTGDFLIIYDSNIDPDNQGTFRINHVNSAGTTVYYERRSGETVAETPSLSEGGIVVVRSSAEPQQITVPASSVQYTAASFADAIDLAGATASVYKTNKIRVKTNRFLVGGNIALVAQNDLAASSMNMDLSDAILNLDSHIASKEATNYEYGTPEFYLNTITTQTAPDSATVSALASSGVTSGHHIVFGNPPVNKSVASSPATTFYKRKDNLGFHSALKAWGATSIETRRAAGEFIANERFWMAAPYALGPEDSLGLLVDNDEQSKRYVVPFFKEVRAKTSTYGTSNDFTEVNGDSLTGSFGMSYDFEDFAVFMRARTKTHNELGDSNKTVLYRYFRHGPDGNNAKLKYIYATEEDASTAVNTRASDDDSVNIDITIPSGSLLIGPGDWNRPTTKLGATITAGTGTLQNITYVQYYRATSSISKIALVIDYTSGTFNIGNIITSFSGGSATLAEKYGPITGGDKILLILDTVTNDSFLSGEAISSSSGGAATAVANGVKFHVHTLSYPATVTGHGLHPYKLTVNTNVTPFVVGNTIATSSGSFIGVVTKVTAAGTNRYIYNVRYAMASGTYIGNSVSNGTDTGIIEAFGPGDELYFSSSVGSFASGNKVLFSNISGTICYTGVDGSYSAVANAGNVFYDETGAFNTTFGGASSGDLMRLGPSSGVSSDYQQTRMLSSFTSSPSQYWIVSADTSATPFTVAEVLSINTDDWKFFENGSASAATIASDIHALYIASNSVSPVDAVAVGDGLGDTSGIVNQSSYDEFPSTSNKHYLLTDGINWTKTVTDPVLITDDYTLEFKDGITASLATNSDWDNEDIKLVPVTAKNVKDWLNTQSISGLSSVAETGTAYTFDSAVATHTLTIGSGGAIQVQNGSANAVSSQIIGGGSVVDTDYGFIEFDKTDSLGLRAGHWVELSNTKMASKQIFTSATTLAVSVAGTITATVTPFWTWANTATGTVSGTFQVEKQGDYVAYIWTGLDGTTPDFAGVEEGDYVRITSGVAGSYDDADTGNPVTGINSLNTGLFRVIRINNTQKVFWIENINATEEIGTCVLWFIGAESTLPGDTLKIDSTLLGASNQGSWTVNSFSNALPGITTASQYTLNVTNSSGGIMAVVSPAVTLGSSAGVLHITEGGPSKLLKKIRSISPSPDDSEIVQIKFESSQGMNRVSEAYGTLLVSKDKLAFDSSSNSGIDGYKYAIGLIQEANKVAYGTQYDPATYPGIIAAGANVNIEGPFVKKVTCALALRLKTGISSSDIINRVKSAVASYINGVGVGEDVAISSIVSAAGSIGGVIAVTVLSPTYSSGNDLIPIQPFEKALVLDLENDITVSLVNEQ